MSADSDRGHDALRVRAGISYRQLDHWCRLGLVPDVMGLGRGNAREFTPRAERRVLTLARLVRAGMAVTAAAEVAKRLERDGWVDMGDGLRLSYAPPEGDDTPAVAVHEVQPCPECGVGKHGNCDGMTWDNAADEPRGCPCAEAGHAA